MLKTDRSWGGDGVTVFHDQRGAARAFAKLSARPSLAKVAKRLFIDGDVTPLLTRFTSEDPQLSVQTFVQGPAGNAAVVCLEGKVLAAVYVEVVHSGQVNGPATVVRVIDHPEMDYSVRAMVKRLGLSGLCGFDFILSPDDGGACLIELNPRATPTCHLRNAEGQDLLSVLAAKLSRRSTPRPHTDSGERVVALFPQELQRDPQSPYLESQGHDVPWGSPELVELGLASLRGPRKGQARRALPRLRAHGATA